MLVLTVKEFLETDNINEPPDAFIYLVRDGDIIFYVGQSRNLAQRISEHLGHGRKSASDLGELILGNMPDSENWIIEFHTIKDCSGKVKEHYGIDYSQYTLDDFCRSEMLLKTAIDFSEIVMINDCRPCLNVTYNANRTALPLKYIPIPIESSESYLRRRH